MDRWKEGRINGLYGRKEGRIKGLLDCAARKKLKLLKDSKDSAFHTN